jgi:hypothetical protein
MVSPMKASHLVLALAAFAALAPSQLPAQTFQGGASVDPTAAERRGAASSWRSLYELDLDYLGRTVPRYYIYALYPGGAEWDRLFRAAMSQARSDAALVHDFASYRAALQRFVVSFGDAHFSAYFNNVSRRARWPGFTVVYRGGGYVVATSTRPDVKAGSAISACDGQSIDAWVDRLAAFYGGPKGLETTRATIARQMFVDRDNPFYALPANCRIAGADVALSWTQAPPQGAAIAEEPERTSASAPTLDDPHARIGDFGADGAWVRIGTMLPETAGQAAEFNRLIAEAPKLRDRSVIVIDVRGNAGGTYNWFMAFLRGLYGAGYADYYATARLEIAAAQLVYPTAAENDPGFGAEMNAIRMPPDPPMEVKGGAPKMRQLPGGVMLASTPAPITLLPPRPRKAPANPVKAKVYVLTDYGCASACISFIDEMKRFPGVKQIGAQTHIDRRSGGWPARFELPSGLALVRMGRMVREGRARGENETWTPAYRFNGDIADTAAVQKWILTEVIPRDQG